MQRKTMKNDITCSAGGSDPLDPPWGVPHTGPPLRLILGYGKCPKAIRIKKYAYLEFFGYLIFYENRYN